MSSSVEPWPDRVRTTYAGVLADAATVDDGFGPLSVDVPAERWVEAVTLARDGLHCTFFDWLSAVDELADGFRVVCHLAARRTSPVEHLLLRTLVPRTAPVVASVADVFAGARWHERETHEMFGIDFTANGSVLELETLLLPEEFEGHPLRKDFVLASRVAKPWPGAKEPGESDHADHADQAGHAGPAPATRRRARPPGSPEPEQWGPRPPGSPAPDPLAAAAAGPAARARRAPRTERRPERRTDGPAGGDGG